MTIQTSTVLKSYFETGDRPTQAQFADFIDTALQSTTVFGRSNGPIVAVSGDYTTSQVTESTNKYFLATKERTKLSSIITPEDYGAVGDGNTDDTTAMQAAFTAAANKMLYIPHKTYLLSAQITLTNAGITILSACGELRWSSGSSSQGISITSNNASQRHVIDGLTLTTAKTLSGTALTLNYSGQIIDVGGGALNTWDRFQPRFLLTNMLICGASVIDSSIATTNGWVNAAYIIAAITGAIRDCVFIGKTVDNFVTHASTTGIIYEGNPAGSYENGHPVQFIHDNLTLYYFPIGINVNRCEGICISNSNIVACGYGVNLVAASHPYFTATDTHFNCSIIGINIGGQRQCSIKGCEFFMIQSSTNAVGVNIVNGSDIIIVEGNFFTGLGATANCVVVDGAYCLVDKNIFLQSGTSITSCIVVQTNAVNCVVGKQLYDGSFTNQVANLSSSATNIVTEFTSSTRRSIEGLEEKWGSTVTTLNGSGDGTITFPTAFRNNIYGVLINNGDNSVAPTTAFIVTGKVTTGFTFSVRASPGAATVRVEWRAWGN